MPAMPCSNLEIQMPHIRWCQAAQTNAQGSLAFAKAVDMGGIDAITARIALVGKSARVARMTMTFVNSECAGPELESAANRPP